MGTVQSMHHDILWGVRRSIRYHSRRRMHYDQFNTITSALGVIFGSATILSMLTNANNTSGSVWWTVIPAAIVTAFSSLNLVIGSSRMAQLHHDLTRRFIQLEQDLVKMEPSEKEDLRDVQAKRLQIEADEPPVKRIVDVLCHNELMKAEGYAHHTYSGHYYKVGTWQRFFSPICDIGADKIESIPEHKPSIG